MDVSSNKENAASASRIALVNEAISASLVQTFQSKHAGEQLESAVSNYNFSDEMGTVDNMLQSFTNFAVESAQQYVQTWLQSEKYDLVIAALDRHKLNNDVKENENTAHQVPNATLPEAVLNNLALARKERELQLLKDKLEERRKILEELREGTEGDVKMVHELSERMNSFAQQLNTA